LAISRFKLTNGRTMTARNHDYKKHSTTPLFAAINVVAGDVKVGQY
jgi:hypothetical protein